MRIGFEQGLFSGDHVRTWVDAEIGARAVLPTELLELATMAHRHDDEIAALVAALDGDVPVEFAALVKACARAAE